HTAIEQDQARPRGFRSTTPWPAAGVLDGMPATERKTALITGASSGIGRHAAIRVAERGARVIVTYNGNPDGAAETVALIEQHGGEAVARHLDVGRSETFAAFAAELGVTPLHYLVHNAGFGGPSMFADTSEELYDAFHRVLLKGPYFLTQTLLPRL